MERLELDYLKPDSARRYDFYLIPKLLIDHEAFDGIDYGAKILYSLLLSRASLSAKNSRDFVDSNGALYIIYTVDQVMTDMRCSNKTAIKMLKQLDDLGLIEKKRQGQGKPSIVYVKDFSTVHFLKCKKYTSRSVDCTCLEVKNLHSNYNNISENDSSENILSTPILSISSGESENLKEKKDKIREEKISTQTIKHIKKQEQEGEGEGEGEGPRNIAAHQSIKYVKKPSAPRYDYNTTLKVIKSNIDYDQILFDKTISQDMLDEICHTITTTICTEYKDNYIDMKNERVYAETVRSVFFKINREEVEYFAECYEKQKEPIGKPREYIRAALYRNHGTLYHQTINSIKVGYQKSYESKAKRKQ